MSGKEIRVVTGAYGFTGKYITKKLLAGGIGVRTLTGSQKRKNPFGAAVDPYPYSFDAPEKLTDALRGASVLYNNYWVRFNHSGFTFAEAVENTRVLFKAAKKAGIKKIVHVSITNPSEDSPFEYFRGKAAIERALVESGLPHAILRPAVIFGKEDILINNIAWALRKFPVFGIFGDGSYRLQPIYVEDLAEIVIEEGEKTGNAVFDAIGPETFTYRELVEEIGKAIGKRRALISIPPALGYCVGSLVGLVKSDVFITNDEIKGLMSNLLYTDSPPRGKTKLSEWLRKNSQYLGVRYSSELARRENRLSAYEEL